MRYDYRYDRKNQLLAKTAGGRTLVSYAYDADGNRTACTDVTGNCTKYTYDLLGRMTGVRDEKTGFLETYEYTKAGDLKKVDTPVLHTAYAYDGDRNLTALRTMAAGDASVEKILADNTYRYNKNGQRTEKTTLAGTTKYTYDVLGQLIQENNHIYTYDRAGNRTSVQAGDRREIYHYDRGRLTTRTVERAQDPAGKTYTYRYDAQGNTLGDGENTYLYDCLNRIAEVQTKAGDIQKNHYDAEGLRSQMEENGKLVSFIYADREVITEEDEAGEHIRYIRGHELLASDSERARTYYHYACDEMGSITDITDCHGTVLNHYAYDAFGNRTVEEETVENRFGFAGEMMDAVTGQYYLRARFYNPVIARFLSEDTYYGDGLNLYAYCHNNPVGYVDPSGHEGLICSKKYGELKKKEAEGGTLSEKEKRQIYEYEQNQKKSNGAGSDSKSGNNSTKYVSWMNEWAYSNFYDKANATLGAKGGVSWVMKDTDAAMCMSIGAVARDTGMAGGLADAYKSQATYIYGVVVDSDTVNVYKPNMNTPGVNANWNSNGKTAVNGPVIGSDSAGNNIPGFVMDTGVEEFVIDGGNPMPAGSYAFKMDDYGNITILRRW